MLSSPVSIQICSSLAHLLNPDQEPDASKTMGTRTLFIVSFIFFAHVTVLRQRFLILFLVRGIRIMLGDC